MLCAWPAAAIAVPQSKLDRARAVKAEVDRLDRRLDIVSDDYNEAAARHAELLEQKARATARLRVLTGRLRTVERRLGVRAESMYRHGPLGFLEVLLGAKSFEEFAATWDLLRDLNESDAEAVRELKELRKEAAETRALIAKKERAARAQKRLMAARLAEARGALEQRKRLLRGLEAEIEALRRAEEAQRRVTTSWFAGPSRVFPPPTRAPRSEVVSIAMRYLGAPYRWAAAGPDAFDCSGFTMFVYRQVGVSLPHSSRAQIAYGERVSRADLQPGDLVFFGSPIHHVGIYIGGGRYIHAPSSGDVVKISSIARGDYAGACRP